MADKKITELNEATTPLTGDEVLPIVQNSETVQVSVNELKNLTITESPHSNTLTFSNLLGVFHSDYIQDAIINFELSETGNVKGSTLYKKITSDEINPIIFSSDFDSIQGMINGDILEYGVYEFYFLYKPNGNVSVNVLQVTETGGDVSSYLEFKDFVNTVQNANLIEREGGSTGWTNGAISVNSILQGVDTEYQFEVEPFTGNVLVASGLNNYNINNSYTDIDFCIVRSGSLVSIFENGSEKAQGVINDLSVGDILKIKVISNTVTYYRNDVLLYTSLQSPVFPLFVDLSINSLEGKLKNPKFVEL